MGVDVKTGKNDNKHVSVINKHKEIIILDLLDDYTGTLTELRDIINNYIKELGDKHVSFDAGYNNVSVLASPLKKK